MLITHQPFNYITITLYIQIAIKQPGCTNRRKLRRKLQEGKSINGLLKIRYALSALSNLVAKTPWYTSKL